MSQTVVSNAGPLMVLSKLNLLHLMKKLYDQVYFPYSVYNETVQNGIRRGFPDAHSLKLFLDESKWSPTHVKGIPNSIADENLDQGEKEAIALSLSKNALLLIDEEHGRNVARKNRLKVRGSLGILIESYRNELITGSQLRYYFKQISERVDVWINPEFCHRLLEQVLISE